MTILSTPRRARAFAFAALAGLAVADPASADRIKHPTAVFAGLDKITGRIISFEAATDETVQFGSLQVTAKACFTRPPTEAPQTTTFVEVDEVGAKQSDAKRIFSGWMFASSPGLHGVEHAVYDIWLTNCKGGTEVIKTPAEVADLPPDADDPTLKTPKPGAAPATAGARPRRPQPGDADYVPPSAAPGAPAATAARPAQLPPPVAVQPRQPTRAFFPTFAQPTARPDMTERGGNR